MKTSNGLTIVANLKVTINSDEGMKPISESRRGYCLRGGLSRFEEIMFIIFNPQESFGSTTPDIMNSMYLSCISLEFSVCLGRGEAALLVLQPYDTYR